MELPSRRPALAPVVSGSETNDNYNHFCGLFMNKQDCVFVDNNYIVLVKTIKHEQSHG